MWNSKGELISASYKKFFNFEEKPDIDPFPSDTSEVIAIDKLDGSTLILSYYKGVPIIRTRGSSTTISMPNHFEIESLKKIYPKLFSHALILSEEFSLILEWTSPNQKIVLDYGPTPELYLTNCISHSNYRYTSQSDLDYLAEELEVKRPKRFDIKNISDLIQQIKDRTDIEGICLYFNNDQGIRKVKSILYLKLHAFKSELSAKNLVNLYIEAGKPSRMDLLKKVETELDFECAQMADPICDKIYPHIEYYNQQIANLDLFNKENKNLDQKEFALKLKQNFSEEVLAFGFSLRKNQPIKDSYLLKLLQEKIKNEPEREIQSH